MEQILCPHCNKSIELTEAFTHQLKDEIASGLKAEHEKQLETLLKETEAKVKQKLTQELETKLKNTENESLELKDQNKALRDQLLELNKSLRSLREKDEERELEMEKRLHAEQEKIKDQVLKQTYEEHRLKDLEKEKVINDLRKALDDAKRKAEQGSMQTQGEVLELDLENLLRTSFPHDVIEPVGKGISGADVKQIVKSPRGTECGIILWEFKRTKHWSDDWINKLKQDIRSEKANLGALISQVLPEQSKNGIGLYNGIWTASYTLVLPLAALLRKNLLDVGYQKAVSANSSDKAQQLYNYITSHEFRQQIEALVDVFAEMNDQVLKERIAFEKSWKQREGQVKRLFLSTANMIGGMQGTGATIAHIKGLELLEEGESQPNVTTEADSQATLGL